jgi:Glycosyl hydrolase family 12
MRLSFGARNIITGALVLVLAVAAAVVLYLVPAVAGGVTLWNAPVCGHRYVPVDLGKGNYFNVYNAPDGSTCVTVERKHLDWYVSSASGTKLWGYPNISSGIEWGKYTCYDGRSAYPGSKGSTCMRYPVMESRDGAPVASIGHVWPHLAQGNVSFDTWFNRADVAPARLGQADGAEIMIWLQHPRIAVRNVLWTATVSGHRYDVIGWIAAHNGKHWNYLAYVAVHPMSSFPATRLNGFFRDAISHGRLSPRWWLTGIDFGEEIARGGNGFAVRDYSLTGVKLQAGCLRDVHPGVFEGAGELGAALERGVQLAVDHHVDLILARGELLLMAAQRQPAAQQPDEVQRQAAELDPVLRVHGAPTG